MEENFSNKVLIINGFNGTGKTILLPILDAYKNTLIPVYSSEVDGISNLFLLKELNNNAFTQIFLKTIDYKLYNAFIGRETNTRYYDLTSIWKSSKLFEILKNIFNKNDEYLYKKGGDGEKILTITITHAFESFPAMSQALNERLLFCEFIRDPLYMFLQNLILHKKVIYGDRRKDFTLRYFDPKSKNIVPPYYKEKDYTKNKYNSLEDYVLIYLENLVSTWEEHIPSFKNYSNFELIPFEEFVLNPKKNMENISNFCSEDYRNAKLIKKRMKGENIPRDILTKGRMQNIYKRYGLKNIKSNSLLDERQKYKSYLKNQQNIKDSIVERLDFISQKYYTFLTKNKLISKTTNPFI